MRNPSPFFLHSSLSLTCSYSLYLFISLWPFIIINFNLKWIRKKKESEMVKKNDIISCLVFSHYFFAWRTLIYVFLYHRVYLELDSPWTLLLRMSLHRKYVVFQRNYKSLLCVDICICSSFVLCNVGRVFLLLFVLFKDFCILNITICK